MLGPVEVVVAGQISTLRPLECSLLAALVAHLDRVVSIDRLVEALWDGAPPLSARNRVQALVSGLRRVVGADAVVTVAPGYVIRADAVDVDLVAFESAVADGHADLAGGRYRRAADALAGALAMWRGTPFEGADSALVRAAGARLVDLYREAQSDWVDARLALGEHRQLTSELSGLVSADPLFQRLRGQLMLALYRSDRQSEALECYREGAVALVDAHGLDPGEDLQRLQRAILAGTADLRPGPAGPPPPAAPADASPADAASSAPPVPQPAPVAELAEAPRAPAGPPNAGSRWVATIRPRRIVMSAAAVAVVAVLIALAAVVTLGSAGKPDAASQPNAAVQSVEPVMPEHVAWEDADVTEGTPVPGEPPADAVCSEHARGRACVDQAGQVGWVKDLPPGDGHHVALFWTATDGTARGDCRNYLKSAGPWVTCPYPVPVGDGGPIVGFRVAIVEKEKILEWGPYASLDDRFQGIRDSGRSRGRP